MITKHSLVLIRHGDTNLNSGAAVERLRGWLDVPLNADGIREAGANARLLRNIPFKHIYTSDLSRAKDTAQVIQKTLESTQKRKVPFTTTRALRPWNMGQLQGQAVEKITPIMLEYVKNPTIAVPEGESFHSFIQRFLPFFQRALKEAQADGPILLLAHTRNLRIADAWYYGGQEGKLADGPIMKKEHLHTGEGLIFTRNGNTWKRSILINPVTQAEPEKQGEQEAENE